jgi:acetylornithine deacetylase/succinyl-diaminopimelate desuccinylase-like protein
MKSALPILLSASLALGCPAEPPRPQGRASQPALAPARTVPAFKGGEAFRFLTAQTDFGPRNPGSGGHARCLEYLERTLTGLADTVRSQHFTHTGYERETLRMTNLVASFNVNSPARILLCAHWDTRPRADADPDLKRRDEPILGANDGASGVAVLLQLATLMHAQPPPVGVDIVLFDGEDFALEFCKIAP